MTATLLWLRQDLRLRDNDALRAAAARGQPVLPVYIWSPQEEGLWPPGAASRWWLHHSLAALDADLRRHGLRLILRRGAALEVLRALIRDSGATAVYWNRRYEPAAQQCSSSVKRALRRDGVEVRSFNSTLLLEPSEFLNQSGKPYQVYTPFMRQVLARADPAPAQSLPRALRAPPRWPASDALDSLELLPRIPLVPDHVRPLAAGRTGCPAAAQKLPRYGARALRACAGSAGRRRHLEALGAPALR